MKPDEIDFDRQLRSAQLAELGLKNEKLTLELNELRRGKPWHQILIQFVPIVTAIIAIAGFWWGLHRYRDDQRNALREQAEQSKREQVTRDREFMKPWVDNQRETYRRALSATGTLGNTENTETQRKATEEFWRLYHGEMILVETLPVKDAMVHFGRCLDGHRITCSKSEINDRSHRLGTAMADSMSATAARTYQEFAADQFKYK